MRPVALISFHLFSGDHSNNCQLESVALRISYRIDPYSVVKDFGKRAQQCQEKRYYLLSTGESEMCFKVSSTLGVN